MDAQRTVRITDGIATVVIAVQTAGNNAVGSNIDCCRATAAILHGVSPQQIAVGADRSAECLRAAINQAVISFVGVGRGDGQRRQESLQQRRGLTVIVKPKIICVQIELGKRAPTHGGCGVQANAGCRA